MARKSFPPSTEYTYAARGLIYASNQPDVLLALPEVALGRREDCILPFLVGVRVNPPVPNTLNSSASTTTTTSCCRGDVDLSWFPIGPSWTTGRAALALHLSNESASRLTHLPVARIVSCFRD